jgi:hypothetical protein
MGFPELEPRAAGPCSLWSLLGDPFSLPFPFHRGAHIPGLVASSSILEASGEPLPISGLLASLL